MDKRKDLNVSENVLIASPPPKISINDVFMVVNKKFEFFIDNINALFYYGGEVNELYTFEGR